MIFVVVAIMLTLFVPATHVDEHMLGQFGTDLAKVRTQGLALFGLPIKIPRRARPITTPVANSTTSNTIPQNDTQAADLVLALLERADLVQMVTMVPTPTITPTPTIIATATRVVTATPAITPTIPVATEVIQATATLTPTLEAATVIPEATATVEVIPVVPTETVLLPKTILNGFRSRMPNKGYWWESTDGVYIAIGSIKYQSSFYGNDAESYQKYVTFSITIRNNRNPNEAAIIVDPANMTLIDLDNRKSTVHRDYLHLNSAFWKNTIAPGQSDGGQLIFVLERFTAPAQLVIAYANADQPDVLHTQTVEFRVWPTID